MCKTQKEKKKTAKYMSKQVTENKIKKPISSLQKNKTTMRYYFTSIKLAKKKKSLTIPSIVLVCLWRTRTRYVAEVLVN